MTRTFQQTHPWLNFQLDLRRAPVSFWMTLGEIRSKCEHIAGVPLDRETATRLHLLYIARGVHATTAIEGNTLALEDVEKRVQGKLQEVPSIGV